ncbi:50S ribosomal protein L25 [Cypionkella aquatica]|uniref:Large ribosomal subunit protein bL25 n=1 Tax=Cypionkella aquatica TaxID=1756042 RepID=A0AA37TVK8_9RHOB|nr:50S ribosomal protein L25/general stress protein Ctc [Cypionkella aquatica]GLS86633.1 50S ribosomal protein L25 [Cypionkella aquatica]
MAREILDLHAEVRTGTGKGAARQSRRDGFVPGIVYGDNTAPLAIKVNYNALLKRLKARRFLSSLFNLKVEGHADVHVICRAVQRDVVKDLPTHIDLMRLHDENRINLFIHVTFINHDAAPGLKKGGTLTVVRNDVELNVLAGDIPDHVTVDLTGKNIGDVIHINDVVLPEGTKATIDRNFVIANVAAPAGYVEASEAE